MNTTLVNETRHTVTYRDGKTEQLALRELSIRDLYRWIEFFTSRNTPALVALCAGRPLEWIDTLTDASFGDLSSAAFKANFPRATALSLKDVTVAALISPHLHNIANLSDGLPLSAKSPAPAASASAPETGSE